ncbi:sodium:solute symporter family transporter [Haloferax sulfurifontis]|uniref:Sodium-solute symporter n=2 Tax=Haloferax sulfurifontis TaxID=255616 RepID=M0IHJ2_9EURY|nr:sodium:solute symporter [Haloferax sulfurifontis]ELZ96241.1 sodium-solute symporter [Haloferax sulfurifontis ATCC BAA-897]GGC65578.1 sodium/panthothenate symporter [Haloferax sulfurifontis]
MVSSTVALGLTVATLVAFTGVGVWFSRGRVGSVEDLISARDSTGSRRTTATLVASVMGVWVLFSAPEAGASFGIAAVVGYAVGEAVPMLVYARLGPRIRDLIPEGHSLTEYAHARYGTAMYAFVLLVSALYMFIFLAAELTGIAGALSLVAGVPQWQTALLVGGFVLLYTSYGGLRASIATDAVQAVVVIPLLLLAFAGALVALGGPAAAIDGITATNPALLDLGAVAGLQFGLALAFAILGAELINQTWWQRIYAADSSETVERSFRTAALANGAIVFITAFFGVVAVGNAAVVTDPASAGYNADAAFFVLLGEAFPEWLVLAAVLLALLLVMSSIDTLFNALSSLVTADLARLLAEPSDRRLALGSRALTIAVAIAAIYVSLRAQSVLRLFFFADLLGAAVAFPLVYGLYSTRITGLGALASSLTGLAVGLAFFPDLRGVITSIPVVGGLLPAADPLYLTSFGGAFVVSTAASLVAARLADAGFDLNRLSREIRRFDDGRSDAPSSD